MKFEEVLEHLRSGKKITRKSYTHSYYIRAILPKEAPDTPYEYILIGNNEGFPEHLDEDVYIPEGKDLFADDWIAL